MNSAQAAKILWESEYVVCLSGREMIVDDGIESMRDISSIIFRSGQAAAEYSICTEISMKITAVRTVIVNIL